MSKLRIPVKDAQLLAGFYGSPAYAAWKRLLANRRISLLEDSLSAKEMGDVRYFRGGTDHMEWEQKTLRDIATKVNLEEETEDVQGETESGKVKKRHS